MVNAPLSRSSALALKATGYPLAFVTATVTVFREGAPWRTIAVRAVGSWIAAIGIMLVGVRAFVP